MDYKKHYNLLIEKALNRNIECYTELHHIVPRCLGGSDEKSNLIKLTPEEHFIAHKLLTKIYPNNLKLLYALNFMSSPVAQRNLNNKSFGFVRKEISKLMQGDLNPIKRFPEKNHMWGKFGKNHPAYGRIVSDYERQKNSKRMKDNNPCKGLSAWDHPRCDDYNKKIWFFADDYYNEWKITKESYCALSKKFGYEKYTASHINMIKKFKSGWIPNQDPKWIKFKKVFSQNTTSLNIVSES
jgi:hypothetical protein